MNGWYAAHSVVIQQTAVYALIALSFQVVLRSGVFSFASVGFFGLGGYLAADLAKHRVPVVLVLAAVVVGAWVGGYALGLLFGRLRGLYLGMVTFAFDEIVVVAANNGGHLTGGVVGLYGVPLVLSTGEILGIAAVACLLVSQLERSAIGRAIAILKVDEKLGRSQGFAVDRQRWFLFALSAALGGIAGAADVLVTSTFASSSFSFNLILLGLTMAVVGGVVSWSGAAVGSVVITWFPEVVHRFASYQDVIYSGLVVLVVVYEPNGLMGLFRRGTGVLRRASSGRLMRPADHHRSEESPPGEGPESVTARPAERATGKAEAWTPS
jgi:branched-chain amino acid transport system permease protein